MVIYIICILILYFFFWHFGDYAYEHSWNEKIKQSGLFQLVGRWTIVIIIGIVYPHPNQRKYCLSSYQRYISFEGV